MGSGVMLQHGGVPTSTAQAAYAARCPAVQACCAEDHSGRFALALAGAGKPGSRVVVVVSGFASPCAIYPACQIIFPIH